MKNSSDTIGNQTRDLSACSVVPQPTASSYAPRCTQWLCIIRAMLSILQRGFVELNVEWKLENGDKQLNSMHLGL
jgi:hypothetical protein